MDFDKMESRFQMAAFCTNFKWSGFWIYLFIYLLGANQKEHTWQMVCKEMIDQCIVERVYVLHEIF